MSPLQTANFKKAKTSRREVLILLAYRPHGSPLRAGFGTLHGRLPGGLRARPLAPSSWSFNSDFPVKWFLYQLLSDSGHRPGLHQCSLSGCQHTTGDNGNYSLCLLNRSFSRIWRTQNKAAGEGCPSFLRLCLVVLSFEFKVFLSPRTHKIHQEIFLVYAIRGSNFINVFKFNV